MERNKMFEKYLYLADEMAATYGNKYLVDEDDAIQEARVCLWNIIDKNLNGDYSIELYFKRYAPRVYLLRMFELYSPVHCTANMVHEIRKGIKELERDRPGDIVKNFSSSRNIGRAKAREALMAAKIIQNLVNYDTFDEEIEIAATVDIEGEMVQTCKIHEIIKFVHDVCTEREADIVLNSFGFFGEVEHFNSMSKRMGISPQRVGQLYKRGMEKLSSTRSKCYFQAIYR